VVVYSAESLAIPSQTTYVVQSTCFWIWKFGSLVGPNVAIFVISGQMEIDAAEIVINTLVMNDGTISGSLTIQNTLMYNSGTLKNGILTLKASKMLLQELHAKLLFSMVVLSIDSTILVSPEASWTLLGPVVNLQSSSLDATSSPSSLTLQGEMTLQTSSVNVGSSTLLMVQGKISGDELSLLKNFGTILTIGPSLTTLDIQIVNLGSLSIQTDTKLVSTYTQVSGSTLQQVNSTLFADASLYIVAGNLDLNGTIFCNNFTVRSNTGMVRIQEHLTVIGNLSLGEHSTLLLSSNGPSGQFKPKISVLGNLNIKGLFVIKPTNNYNPSIGDTLQFFSFDSGNLSPTMNMIGAPFRNGKLNDDGSVQVVYSYGAADTTGYKCNYVGNSKINLLEINIFDLQGKVSLSYTVPKSGGWFGFGFDQNTTIDNSYLFVMIESQLYQARKHNISITTTYFDVVDAFLTESKSIFNLGATYQTVNIFMNIDLLKNQQKLYHASGSSSNFSVNALPAHDYYKFQHFV
jgi:hypothetical protein